jgi:hypothetical protein
MTEWCTTGWLSWELGELWLTDDALLRVGSSELTVRAANLAPLSGALAAAKRPVPGMAPAPLTAVDISPAAWTAYLRERTDVLFVPFAQIASATLRGGLLNGRLTMRLHDGTTRKLLWLRSTDVTRTLRNHLPAGEIPAPGSHRR